MIDIDGSDQFDLSGSLRVLRIDVTAVAWVCGLSQIRITMWP